MFTSRVAITILCAAAMLVVPAASSDDLSEPASPSYADRTLDVGGLRIHYLDWGTAAESLQRTHVRYGTKRREDGRVVWKRDPNLVKGFIPTELWKYVSRITAPTLYVLGGNSKIVPPGTQERLKKTLPRVRIEVMPGIGHYPHLEAPDPFIAMVKGFLRETEAERYKKKQFIR